MENLDSDRTDHTMIEPLVERQYGLCVLLTNAAADGLKNGKLDLNITIGGECYIVNLE